MKKYNFFWKEILVGYLFINENNNYIFLEDKEGKERAANAGMLTYIFPKEQKEWGAAIPFFEGRISRACNSEVIKYHTDEFKLEKKEDQE